MTTLVISSVELASTLTNAIAKISVEDIDIDKPRPLIKVLTEALALISTIPLKALYQALLHILTIIPASILTKVLAEVIAKYLAQEKVLVVVPKVVPKAEVRVYSAYILYILMAAGIYGH